MAPGASTSTTVTMTVPSSITVTNACTSQSGRSVGIVALGGKSTSSTIPGSCRFSFSSSNDTSQLRLGQRDGTGAAMTSFATTYNTIVAPANRYSFIDAAPGAAGTLFAYGTGGVAATTNDGSSWTVENSSLGYPRDMSVASSTAAWLVGWSGTIRKRTGAAPPTVGTWVAPTAIAGATAFKDVDAFSALGAFVATDVGFYRTLDYGSTWAPMNNGMPMTDAKLVDSSSASVAWAINEADDLFLTVDGGNTWVQKADIPGCTGSCSFNDLLAISSTTAYVLSGDNIAYTINGGTSWQNANWTPWTWKVFTGIDGTAGNILVSGTGGWLARSTDGVNFTEVKQPTANRYNDVTVEAGVATLAGEGQVVVRSPDMTTWTVMQAGTPTLNAVDSPADGQVAWAVGSRGTIRKSTDGASTWSPQVSPTSQDLWSVSATDSSIAWAVGDNGTLLQTTDGGASWIVKTSPTGLDLLSVSAPTPWDIWIAGENGKAFRSGNGGTSWIDVSVGTGNINSISAIDKDVAYIGQQGGGILRRTANGGSSWVTQTESFWDNIRSVSAIDANTAIAVGRWNNVQRTIDGGATAWTSFTFSGPMGPNLAVSAVDQDYFAVGGDSAATYRAGVWTIGSSTTTPIMGVKAVDGHRAYYVGEGGAIWRTAPGSAIGQYGGGNTWNTASDVNLFAACIQWIGASTTADWAVDGNTCTTNDSDPWNAVPAALTRIATTTSGATGQVDLVWGARTQTAQPPGTYVATVVIEALAP